MTNAAASPRWADSSRGLGRLIETLIGIGLVRRPLFFQARQLIIRTAERNGIPWRQRREDLRQAAQPLVAASTTPGLQPPRLLPRPFPRLRAGQPLLAGRRGGGAGH